VYFQYRPLIRSQVRRKLRVYSGQGVVIFTQCALCCQRRDVVANKSPTLLRETDLISSVAAAAVLYAVIKQSFQTATVHGVAGCGAVSGMASNINLRDQKHV